MNKREAELAWYHDALRLLQRAHIDFLIGGAYALWKYTGMRRPTKDLDIFLRPSDLTAALRALAEGGFKTEITATHWLGKAFHKDYLVDFIVGMANGVGQINDSWFRSAVKVRAFGLTLQYVGPEDMIWSKAFVMARDRFDGADIAHLIHAQGKTLNWDALVSRFKGHEPVLLSHLILFRYIYPDAQKIIPEEVLRRLGAAAENARHVRAPARLCRGTLFSRDQYAIDVGSRGYRDARLLPYGSLTPRQTLE